MIDPFLVDLVVRVNTDYQAQMQDIAEGRMTIERLWAPYVILHTARSGHSFVGHLVPELYYAKILDQVANKELKCLQESTQPTEAAAHKRGQSQRRRLLLQRDGGGLGPLGRAAHVMADYHSTTNGHYPGVAIIYNGDHTALLEAKDIINFTRICLSHVNGWVLVPSTDHPE